MSKTTLRERSTDTTDDAALANQSFERRLEQSPLPVVPRAAVVGDLIHASRSLERANYAVSVAHRRGDVAQFRAGDQLFLTDQTLSEYTLFERLKAYLERTDEPNSDLVGAVNARIQQLRRTDPDE